MMSNKEGGKYKSYLKGVDDLISPVDVKKILVMDIGSNYTRIGLSGENFPLLNLPTIVAKSKNVNINDLTQTKLPDLYAMKAISEAALRQADYNLYFPLESNYESSHSQYSQVLETNYFSHKNEAKDVASPRRIGQFESGYQPRNSQPENIMTSSNGKAIATPRANNVTHHSLQDYKHTKDEAATITPETFGDLENFYKFAFEDIMQLETSNIELLVLDSIAMPPDFRQRLAEIFFENMRVQSINFISTAVCALFSSGRTYGISVEMGHGSTNVVPIFGGLVLRHAQHVSNYGGKDVTKFINSFLLKNGLDLHQHNMEIVTTIETIKQKIAYCSSDFESAVETQSPLEIEESHIELPDGTIFQFDRQTKFGAAELLLRPGQGFWTGLGSLKKGEMNLVDKIYDAIERCEYDMKKKLSQNILLCGGASQTNNLLSRMRQDYNCFLPYTLQDLPAEIVQESNVPFSAWIGGSILGSISTFQNLKIKKSEFDEAGDLKHNFLFKRTFS